MQRSDSNFSSRSLMNDRDGLRTVFNRETNIDIAYVLKKMFVHFVAEYDEKAEFLPDFDAMIDGLYDADAADQIHYVPVDVDSKRLRDYVNEGKAAKMALLSQQKKEKQSEEIQAAKESLAQHREEKPEHV